MLSRGVARAPLRPGKHLRMASRWVAGFQELSSTSLQRPKEPKKAAALSCVLASIWEPRHTAGDPTGNSRTRCVSNRPTMRQAKSILADALVQTICLHGGWAPDAQTGARAPPVYRTTPYQFDSTEHAANLFGLKELGYIYSRLNSTLPETTDKRS
eukprot:scaffold97_cov261-Pinguiococcus_pyrenoidosus.AAC.10